VQVCAIQDITFISATGLQCKLVEEMKTQKEIRGAGEREEEEVGERQIDTNFLVSILNSDGCFIRVSSKMVALCSSETSVDFCRTIQHYRTRDSSVGIAMCYWASPRGRSSSLGRVKKFPIFHVVHIGSETPLASYPVGTGDKAARA
jgi:hypothetical protein